VKAEAKTASGIYIPEKNVEKLNEADVLAVGPGVVDKSGNKIPVSVQSGDRVLIPPYGGSSIKIGEEDLLLFRDNEILAKVSKE
jgi:chaperonin GroES